MTVTGVPSETADSIGSGRAVNRLELPDNAWRWTYADKLQECTCGGRSWPYRNSV